MFVIVFKMVTMIIFIYIMDSSYILMDKYLIEREREVDLHFLFLAVLMLFSPLANPPETGNRKMVPLLGCHVKLKDACCKRTMQAPGADRWAAARSRSALDFLYTLW